MQKKKVQKIIFESTKVNLTFRYTDKRRKLLKAKWNLEIEKSSKRNKLHLKNSSIK